VNQIMWTIQFYYMTIQSSFIRISWNTE